MISNTWPRRHFERQQEEQMLRQKLQNIITSVIKVLNGIEDYRDSLIKDREPLPQFPSIPVAVPHHPWEGGIKGTFFREGAKKKHPKFPGFIFFIDVKPFSTCFRYFLIFNKCFTSFKFYFYDTILTR